MRSRGHLAAALDRHPLPRDRLVGHRERHELLGRPLGLDPAQLVGADAVTFTSASTVDNFFRALGDTALNGTRLASIGPTTSDAIRKHGRTPDVEAENASVAALRDAVVRVLGA